MDKHTNDSSQRVQRARKQRRMITIGLVAALVCLGLVLGVRALMDGQRDNAQLASAAQTTAPTTSADITPQPEAKTGGEPTEAPEAKTAATTPAPTIKPSTEKVKLLPIIHRKKDEKKKIAITIDDCFSEDYMRKIIALAEKYDAELTFFPKGNTIEKNADLWREIYEKGYQIENHTFTHSNVSKMDDEKLRKNIQDANDALNRVLGVNYKMSIFRCPTGDGMKSQRLHRILRELDYKAVASWGLSGSQNADTVIKSARPGQIILYHATAKDYNRLKKVIPALAKKYKLVSINDLYGHEKNTVTELAIEPEPSLDDAA